MPITDHTECSSIQSAKNVQSLSKSLSSRFYFQLKSYYVCRVDKWIKRNSARSVIMLQGLTCRSPVSAPVSHHDCTLWLMSLYSWLRRLDCSSLQASTTLDHPHETTAIHKNHAGRRDAIFAIGSYRCYVINARPIFTAKPYTTLQYAETCSTRK